LSNNGPSQAGSKVEMQLRLVPMSDIPSLWHHRYGWTWAAIAGVSTLLIICSQVPQSNIMVAWWCWVEFLCGDRDYFDQVLVGGKFRKVDPCDNENLGDALGERIKVSACR
jgi:hypothetical protein